MPTNSLRVDPAARESQVIGFLDAFPREIAPILVGGYAVAAYGPPRFSEDVDLALPAKSLERTESWLKDTGVKSRKTLEVRQAAGTVSKLLISKGLVAGDLYFGGLRARESGAVIDYDWIAKRPTSQRLRLTTGTTNLPFPIARLEALWVLKLLAGRPQDVTDLFVMSEWPVDSSEVRSKLEGLENAQVRASLRKVEARLASDQEYHDSLSRRGLGSPRDTRNLNLWRKFKLQAMSYLADLSK